MMSSPSYNMSDHTNGLSNDQYSSSFISANSNINGNNSKNGASLSNESSAVNFDNEIDNKLTNMLVSNASSLPASSTTSTLSTSSSNATLTSNNNGNGDDVCRDYLRNVCRRGKTCRFKHPDPSDNDALGRKDVFVFCHDYQNRECRRENCRFLHCTKQEEEIFRSTGNLPQHARLGDDAKNSTPICKDFINGICRRAPGRCKFRHPTESFQQSPPATRNSFDGRNGQRGSNFSMCSPNNQSHNLDFQSPYGRQHGAVGSASNIMPSSYGYGDTYAENPNKRKRAFDSMYNSSNGPYSASFSDPMTQVHGYSMPASNQQYYGARNHMDPRSYLEEENIALRRRVDELKKQVTELITTNDYLMEQMNNLRVQSGGPAAAVAVATATSVASLAAQPPPGIVSSTATALGISTPLSQSLSLQGQVPPPPPPPPSGGVIGLPPPPSSIVSSITSISLPTMTTPVSMVNVNSSGAASLVSFTPSLHSSMSVPWPLGVDQ